MTKLKSKTYLMQIITVILLFIFMFFPTSKNGELYGTTYMILVWGIIFFLVVILSFINKIHFEKMIISIILLNLYMIVVTLLAQQKYSNYHISLARIIPILTLIIVTFIEIKNDLKFSYMEKLLHVICLSTIFINIGILLKNANIVSFMSNNYNQYYDLVAYYSYVYGSKPVMTFGVHTYASYFYFIFFVLCYFTYEKTNKKIFLIYCLFFCVFCFFLISTTAIIYFILMILFLLKKLLKNINKNKIFFLLFFLISISLVLLLNYNTVFEKLLVNFTNGNNSFISRYSSNSVFNENFKVITSSLGIGYNIIDNLNIGYSDSGYIVYLTMGSIPLMLFIYYRLYKFIVNNIERKYRGIIIFIIFSFEIALPATFNYRFIPMILFVILYFKSLSYNDNIMEEVKYAKD